jgi:hypothetical protein
LFVFFFSFCFAPVQNYEAYQLARKKKTSFRPHQIATAVQLSVSSAATCLRFQAFPHSQCYGAYILRENLFSENIAAAMYQNDVTGTANDPGPPTG